MNHTHGILIVCNAQFIVEEVVFNGLETDIHSTIGIPFLNLIIPADHKKANELIHTVKTGKSEFNWELNLLLNNETIAFIFWGMAFKDKFVLIGGFSNNELMSIFNEMMAINNEQVNRLRTALKSLSEFVKKQADLESDSLDEMSKLNNELANLQRKMAKQNIELKRLNEIKNQFLGIAAHDLRNPLGNVINLAEFFEDDSDQLSEEQLDLIRTIKSLGVEMLTLVNELLDVSAIESGSIQLTLEPVDYLALIKKNINLNKILADKKDISIQILTSINDLWIQIDSNKINQVINNLITNAIKYSNPGTQMTVKIKQTDNKIITSVIDQGQGIPENELDLLFKAFQKTSTRSTAGESSTGLGLFIVKRIVDSHGGEIWAESKISEGSKFHFSLPLTQK